MFRNRPRVKPQQSQTPKPDVNRPFPIHIYLHRTIKSLRYIWRQIWSSLLKLSKFLQITKGLPKNRQTQQMGRHHRHITPKVLQFNQGGFLLPAVTMLLLVMSLVVGSILMKVSQQSTQTVSARETQVINNTATIAINRAKSKLEYLFNEDPAMPNTIPSERTLEILLLDGNDAFTDDTDPDVGGENQSTKNIDEYTLPGEQRLKLPGDTEAYNVWMFKDDVNGDGTQETIVYSITLKDKATTGTGNNMTTIADVKSNDTKTKAKNKVTRSGPLSISAKTERGECDLPELKPEEGWYPINSVSFRKNIQIDALVLSAKDKSSAVTALEVQQDRALDLGSKWGAWFAYDLELHPGPAYNWNGAMYTAGNLMLGKKTGKEGDTRFYLVSTSNSCVYTRDASEIVVADHANASGIAPDARDGEFQGQVMMFDSDTGNWNSNNAIFNQFDLFVTDTNDIAGTPERLTNGNDSVKDTGSPYKDYALNPIALFTEGKYQARTGNGTNRDIRDPNWDKDNNPFKNRITNSYQQQPFVDDTYRADDRYGPKTQYNNPQGKNIDTLDTSNNGKPITGKIELTREDPPDIVEANDNVGLDGYWERRARNEGLRLIIGPRLQLGNTYGWKGNDDPLYPIQDTTLTNEQRQYKTLRDNAAAVQAMAVYHHAGDNKDFPLACVAVTDHPGTLSTITNSTTFTTDGDGNVITNFFTGKGTNGWEFPAPASDAEAFATAIADNQPLGIAMRNLAYFSGDPDGAFPAKQEPKGDIAHPYPELAMWGDFSELRRVFDDYLDNGVTYDNLSIADKTTLHTAACTVGMLAYNINISQIDNLVSSVNLNAFGEAVSKLFDGNISNGEYDPTKGYKDYLAAIKSNNPSLATLADTALVLEPFNIIERDRKFGFKEGNLTSADFGINYGDITFSGGITVTPWIDADNNGTGQISWKKGRATKTYETKCDPLIFKDVLNPSNASNKNIAENELERLVGLSLVFCGDTGNKPKYPSLFYLFPTVNHDHNGVADDQPTANEDYISKTVSDGTDTYNYIFDPTKGVNRNVTYTVLKTAADGGIGDVDLVPTALADWKLPKTTTNTGISNKITFNGTNYYVPFLDKAIWDGRQLMKVRTLDIDLAMLTNSVNTYSSSVGSEPWLPPSGIVYAFRQDAVREDGIARPAANTAANCDQETDITFINGISAANSVPPCAMDVANNKDPRLNAKTGISPKPVDFYADPARRPHAFRLRNGSDLRRSAGAYLYTKADITRGYQGVGISFISDNPVYIQGDFNLHTHEEFTSPSIADNWDRFYDRADLEPCFAKSATGGSCTDAARLDHWQRSEIMADAISILSDDFCDGTIEDLFTNNTTCSNPTGAAGQPSYLNTRYPLVNPVPTWQRDKIGDNTSPIAINRNGIPQGSASFAAAFDTTITKEKDTQNERLGSDNKATDDTTVNTVFISAVVPSRPGQTYGGLHNYPRFLEGWKDKNMRISGAFLQLQFSTYATAPLDQEKADPAKNGWESGKPAITDYTGDKYYYPPNRKWGYDVGLQYNPAGNITARFISRGSLRNEFYSQVRADDDYIMQLRCAKDSNNQQVDPNAVCQ